MSFVNVLVLLFISACLVHVSISDEVSLQNAIRIAKQKCVEYTKYKYKLNDLFPGAASTGKKLLDCLAFTGIITGGIDAGLREFPHMALIGYKVPIDETGWLCGGTLISERYVLTAAHCRSSSFYGLAKYVLLGDLNYASKRDKSKPQIYSITHIFVHPKYKPPSRYHDIVLFRLNTTVTMSAHVRPTCLNTLPLDDVMPKSKKGIITGWGQTDVSETVSSTLKKTSISFLDKSKCDETYNNDKVSFSRGFDADTAVCAGDPVHGNDTCMGDSGGPLQIAIPNNDCMWLQIGITSFGQYDCGNKAPAIYTKVSYYIEWIQKYVWPQS